MKNKSKFLIYFLLLLFGCTTDRATYVVDQIGDEGIIIKNWHVVGPFESNDDEIGLETNYLPNFDKEENIGYDQLKKLAGQPAEIGDTIIVDFNKIFYIKDDDSPHAVAYAGCIIKSSRSQTLKLNFSSDDGSKIWLNQKHIFTDERGSAIYPYHNYIDLPLEQGENFLLVKVANTGGGWAMFAAIEKESKENIRRHKRNFELQFGNVFLSENIIENDTLSLSGGIPEHTYKLEVLGVQNLVFDITPNQNINIGNLPDGFYKTVLYTPTDTFTNRIYKTKDFTRDFERLITNVQSLPHGMENENVKALLHRYNILMKPENLPKEWFLIRNWDRRMLFVFDNLEKEYALMSNQSKEGDDAGTLLKSYRSKIDDGSQYYTLHVPENYDKNVPIPLVIEVSTIMKWFPSQVETNRFANIDLIDNFADMANKYNMIVAEPGNRTVDKPNYNNIDVTDLWETINDIKKAYNIDTTRLFLRGACRAGYEALKMAVKYPDKFAAIAIVAPEIIPDDKSEENIWQHANNPLNFLKNIQSMPFLNIHSVLDTHSPISSSDRLNKLVTKAGLTHFSYRKLYTEFNTFYSAEYMDEMFHFFSESPRLKQPLSVKFSTDQLKYNRSFWIEINHIVANKTANIEARLEGNSLFINHTNIVSYTVDLSNLPYDGNTPLTIYDNGEKVPLNKTHHSKVTLPIDFVSNGKSYKNTRIEGPFAHIFHNAFIVVQGTSGTPEESTKINDVIEKLNTDWQYRYYTDFRIKPDTVLTEEDLANFNLILVGSTNSNQVIKKMIADLPITVDNESISIGNETMQGQNLGYYLIYPNPSNHQRYVAVLGSNNPRTFNIWPERNNVTVFQDVSDFGWYDYKIWDNASPSKNRSGYFNEQWE